MQRIFAAALCAALLMAGPARAEGVVKLVVPFAPGGPVDQVARLVAPDLSAELGATVVVENRGGAGGTIGANAVAKAAPDGQTLLVATLGYVMSAGTTPHLPYDPRKDLTPLYLFGQVQSLLVVRNSLGVSTPAELVKLARSGAPLSYGSSGVGSTMHIGGELFNIAAGAKATHVPYRGARADRPDRRSGGHGQCRRAGAAALCEGRTRQGHRHLRHPALALSARRAQRAGGRLPALQMSNWYGALAQPPRRWPRASGWNRRSPRSSQARAGAQAGRRRPLRPAGRGGLPGQAQRRPGPLGAHDPPGRHPHGMIAMRQRHRLLMIGPLPPGLRAALAERYELDALWEQPDCDAWLRASRGRYAGGVTMSRHGCTEAMLACLAGGVLACFGVGHDGIDLEAARRHGVQVSITPDVLDDCVADLAFGLVLATARRIPDADRHVQAGRWPGGPYRWRRASAASGSASSAWAASAAPSRAAPPSFDMALRYHGRAPAGRGHALRARPAGAGALGRLPGAVLRADPPRAIWCRQRCWTRWDPTDS